MTIANVCTHSSKYFEPTLYTTILNNLHTVAARNRDPHGWKNYILPFIESLKQSLRYIDERISCLRINRLATPKTKPFPPKSSINNTTANSNNTVKQKSKCLICSGNHKYLFKCKELPTFIPAKNFKPLPQGICGMCLMCDGSKKIPNLSQSQCKLYLQKDW